jgi:hypothetical protein
MAESLNPVFMGPEETDKRGWVKTPCIADRMLLNAVIRMLAAGAGSEARRCARRTISPWDSSMLWGLSGRWLGIITAYVTDTGIELTKAMRNPAADFPGIARIGIIPPKGRHPDRPGSDRIAKKTATGIGDSGCAD